MGTLREVRASFGIEFPKIEGRTFKAFCIEGTSDYVAEVTVNGADAPEWSAEGRRLETLVARTAKHYGLAQAAQA